MKIMEAGFSKMVTDNIPKRAKMSKVPVVKAKDWTKDHSIIV